MILGDYLFTVSGLAVLYTIMHLYDTNELL